MAKLKAPMLSMAASGTIGDSVIFSSWKGRPYAKKLTIPRNPKSGGQVGNRAMLKFLSVHYSSLTAADIATWSTAAAAADISPYNAFIAYNLDRWHRFQMPSKFFPASDFDDPSLIAVGFTTPGPRSLLLTIGRFDVENNWGLQIHRSTTGGFTMATGNAVKILFWPNDVSNTITWRDTPLKPDTYYYRVRCFSISGDSQAGWFAQFSGTVT